MIGQDFSLIKVQFPLHTLQMVSYHSCPPVGMTQQIVIPYLGKCAKVGLCPTTVPSDSMLLSSHKIATVQVVTSSNVGLLGKSCSKNKAMSLLFKPIVSFTSFTHVLKRSPSFFSEQKTCQPAITDVTHLVGQ